MNDDNGIVIVRDRDNNIMMTVSLLCIRCRKINRETLNERAQAARRDGRDRTGNPRANESHTSSMTAPPVMAANEEGTPHTVV